MTIENKLELILSYIMMHDISSVGLLCFLKDCISQLSPSYLLLPAIVWLPERSTSLIPLVTGTTFFCFLLPFPSLSSCGVLYFTNASIVYEVYLNPQ